MLFSENELTTYKAEPSRHSQWSRATVGIVTLDETLLMQDNEMQSTVSSVSEIIKCDRFLIFDRSFKY
jgi:hypothetical protein